MEDGVACGMQLDHGVLVVGYGGLKASGLDPSQSSASEAQGRLQTAELCNTFLHVGACEVVAACSTPLCCVP